MIPRLLRVKNFLSYGDQCDPLDFDSMHIACLSGDNGNGKSALLDAILWALWGQSRASGHQGIPQERLINHGHNDMEVEFRFDVEGQTYVALRRLEKRGAQRSPKTSLALSVQGDDGFVPIGGDSIREVQGAINDVLHIDYETFINSAFVLQGRADEFTRQTPGKRKDILSNLLGLDRYIRLQETARQRSRNFDERAAIREADLKAYEAEILLKDRYEAELTSAAAEASRIEGLLSAQATAIERSESLATEERLVQSERNRLLEDQKRARAGQENAQSQLDIAKARLSDLHAVTARENEIRATFELYENLSRRRDELVAELGELADLQKELAAKQREIDRIKNERVSRVSNLNSQRQTYQDQVQAGDRSRLQLQILLPQEERLNSLKQRLAGIRDQMTTVTADRREALARIENLESDQRDLNARIQILDRQGAECPVCRQPLSDDLRDTVKEQARKEWRERRDAKDDLNGTVVRFQQQVEGLNADIRQGEDELKSGEDTIRQIATMQTNIAQAEEASKIIKRLSVELSSLETDSQTGGGWKELEASTKPMRSRVERLGALQGQLTGVGAELSEIANAPADREKLRAASNGAADAHSRVKVENQRLDEFRRELVEMNTRIAEIEIRLPELIGSSNHLEKAKELRHRLARQHLIAVETRSAAQQRVNVIESRIRDAEKIRGEIGIFKQESSYYRELSECFGQRGVQAMLIEQVMPEVEGYANGLLDIITDGRMQVQFLTQRARRGSSSEEPIETLDIIVSDELGTRPYELFSGGEAFRVNFAVRIAISKLLTRRAGTRLQFLVIDEGFGSQDATGRQRLIEAINSISGSFDKILVVTHVEEMKDAFPTRIEVVKEAHGSQIYVS